MAAMLTAVSCCNQLASLPADAVLEMQLSDPSLLRFLVDMRGADPDDKQLRDDLMTMLIAGQDYGSMPRCSVVP